MLTRSHSRSTSARMWLLSRTERPSSLKSSMHSVNTASISGSRPGRRLVEHEQLDVGRQRGHEGDLLAVALGVGAALLGGVELEPLDQVGAPPLVDPAAQPAEQVDDLAAGERRPQVHVAGHVREPAVQLGRVAPRVAAEQPDRAGVGAQQAEQHADRGGLAGPVRAEEAMHLAGGRP